MTQTSTAAAHILLAAKEREMRAMVTAIPAAKLAVFGLGSPEAIEAYIAAEMADEAEALGL